jgi:hypothetical protein
MIPLNIPGIYEYMLIKIPKKTNTIQSNLHIKALMGT